MDRTPAETLRAWAKAYREGPVEHRFPSDPTAEFFPQDMDRGAAEIDWLRSALVSILSVAESDSARFSRANIAEVARRALEKHTFIPVAELFSNSEAK